MNFPDVNTIVVPLLCFVDGKLSPGNFLGLKEKLTQSCKSWFEKVTKFKVCGSDPLKHILSMIRRDSVRSSLFNITDKSEQASLIASRDLAPVILT